MAKGARNRRIRMQADRMIRNNSHDAFKDVAPNSDSLARRLRRVGFVNGTRIKLWGDK